MSAEKMTLQVKGLHCNNCVAGVTEELEELPEVQGVAVDLVPDGVSTVRVDVTTAVSEAKLAETLADAGFELVSVE